MKLTLALCQRSAGPSQPLLQLVGYTLRLNFLVTWRGLCWLRACIRWPTALWLFWVGPGVLAYVSWSFVCGQLFQMNCREIHVLLTASALACVFNSLLESFLDSFKVGVEIKGSALLECHFQLNSRQRRRNATSGYWLYQSCPDIGTEERCRYMGITDIQEG